VWLWERLDTVLWLGETKRGELAQVRVEGEGWVVMKSGKEEGAGKDAHFAGCGGGCIDGYLEPVVWGHCDWRVVSKEDRTGRDGLREVGGCVFTWHGCDGVSS
jgi:hypothetical protein